MNNSTLTLAGLLALFLSIPGLSQHLKPDLSKASGFKASNREFELTLDKEKGSSIYVKSAEGPGVVWLEDVWFSTGTLEFDLKGKDIMQRSFVGIAFHSLNDSTYEAIYFRPFNFNSTEELRRSHSVQYISMPRFDWYNLRESDPGKFENSLQQPVDPNEWFHVKITVKKEQIEVFVNDHASAALTVKPISEINNGKVGFWAGNGSDGTFANLVIRPD